MTLPAATTAEDAALTTPTTRPAPVIAEAAAACVRPTTLGTGPCGVPVITQESFDGSNGTVRSMRSVIVSTLVVVEPAARAPSVTAPRITMMAAELLVTVALAAPRAGVVLFTTTR